MESLSAANTTFALNLFKKLSANDPTKNLVFSPLSISSAMLMVSLGAKDNTEAQMSKVYKDTFYQNEKGGWLGGGP
uniref:Serpin domain-containing protein n=1 Tax=Pseudonaja textilis TaxID=8673 RepID=A0A670ZED4_PSETE